MATHKETSPVGRSNLSISENTPNFPTIVHALVAAAEDLPDKKAFICEDKEITFSQYFRASAGMANKLKELSVPGTRAAILMNNSIEMAIVLMGSYAAGIQCAPLNPFLTDREITELLKDIDPSLLICSESFMDRAEGLIAHSEETVVLSVGENSLDPWGWIDDQTCTFSSDFPSPSDRSVMFFTGGTTGLPKGAEHVHSAFIAFCRQTVMLWQFDYDTKAILNVAPMFHIWGHHFSVLFPLFIRATMVLVPKYQPDFVIDQLERHKVNYFAGGPAAIFLGLLGSDKMKNADLSNLEYSIAGGSPCPEGLLTRWHEETGNEILEGWGMSEGAPINCNPTHGEKKWLSTGVTPPETEIDIVDVETGNKILPIGERGEIRVRGPQFTIGYRNRPDENKTAIRDGWLYTGDIGYFDEDGYMFLVDRKKELIIVGGYNVYPREVDEILTNHPAVSEAAAVGQSDDFLGEVVVAFVALKEGEQISSEELITWSEKGLVKYKVPHEIFFLEALPKKGPGKIDKLSLKQSLL